MTGRISIPEAEYQERIKKAAVLAGQRGLDVLVVNSTEADYANVRYFSDFWPLFETAGVAIATTGKAALMVGPESGEYASDRSMITNIYQLMEYRESADPACPEFKASKYTDVFRSIGVTGCKLRIGVGGYLVSNPIQLAGLRECYPECEIVRADDIMVALRSVKSENEIACIREGLRITELATQEVIRNLKPGMTELQLVGIAQKTIYENGAEYRGAAYVCLQREVNPARDLALDLPRDPEGRHRPVEPLREGVWLLAQHRDARQHGQAHRAETRDCRVRSGGPPLDLRPAPGGRAGIGCRQTLHRVVQAARFL